MDAVEQRMRALVRDDVVRQAGKHRGARRVVGIPPGDREIPEQQRLLRRAVVGVLVAQRVRIDAQPPHEFHFPVVRRAVLGLEPARRPQRHPAERALEMTDGAHGDGVDHLLVELRVALRGSEPVLREQAGIVEIDRRIDHAARRIDVDDFEIFSDRTRLQSVVAVALPGDPNGDLLDGGRLGALGEARVECVDAQSP